MMDMEQFTTMVNYFAKDTWGVTWLFVPKTHVLKLQEFVVLLSDVRAKSAWAAISFGAQFKLTQSLIQSPLLL